MPKMSWIQGMLLAFAAFTVLAPGKSSSQSGTDADSREVMAYTLTEAGLAKFTQATRKLHALPDHESGDCDEDSDAKSLDAQVTRFNATPGAQAAIQSAGMTTREYVVFLWSLFQNGLAAWAVDQPGGKLPPGISKANVDFVKQHQTAIQQTGGLDDDCDDDSEDNDDDDDDDDDDEDPDDA